MPRAHRIDPTDGWHHVMNRGVDHMIIFRDDHDRRRFIQLIDEASFETGVRVVAYCLVGNHFHLVLHCPSRGLSAFMWHLTSNFARFHNHRHDRDGALFRGRFLSKPVTDDHYLRQLIRYVHRNALDIGTEPAAWPWSSCQVYLGLRRPSRFLDIEPALDIIGGSDQHRSDLAAATPSDEQLPPDGDPASLARLFTSVDKHKVIDRIADELTTIPSLPASTRRAAFRLLVVDYAGISSGAVFAALGASSANAARTQLVRARRKAESDPQLAMVVRHVASVLGLETARSA